MLLTESQVHVLRLDKGHEHYLFMYTKEHVRDVLRMLAHWAGNPDLSFNWYDAARLSHEIRKW
jgi:trehalose utilization protein